MPQIEEAYIKTGLVKYVVRDFPLEQIHHDAFKAAEAAHCAGDRGAFWPMHARLFARQTDLTLDELTAHLAARGVGKELWPERLVVLEELPRSSGGKLAKGELTDRARTL